MSYWEDELDDLLDRAAGEGSDVDYPREDDNTSKADRRIEQRRVGECIWRSVVDTDCDPTSNVVHLMYLCGDYDCCDSDLMESRHPLCKQVFVKGWMQDEPVKGHRHCKKCEKFDQRTNIERRTK